MCITTFSINAYNSNDEGGYVPRVARGGLEEWDLKSGRTTSVSSIGVGCAPEDVLASILGINDPTYYSAAPIPAIPYAGNCSNWLLVA